MRGCSALASFLH